MKIAVRGTPYGVSEVRFLAVHWCVSPSQENVDRQPERIWQDWLALGLKSTLEVGSANLRSPPGYGMATNRGVSRPCCFVSRVVAP